MISRSAIVPVTNQRGEFMATPLRTLFKFIIGLFATAPAGGTASAAETGSAPPPKQAETPAGGTASGAKTGSPTSPKRAETLTLSAFIARVRQDATLRARFAQNPHTVLREFGIDPTPYNLPDRLTDVTQLDRFLADWSRDAGASTPPRVPEPAVMKVPTPVYGPPPGFPKGP
jgi:hypothetical protein